MHLTPDYIFESSWEVCNKVGGIYTVLSSRAKTLQDRMQDRIIFIGPDFWNEKESPYFKEDKSLFADWQWEAKEKGLLVRVGRWTVPGEPIAILVDFQPFFKQKNDIYAWLWEHYQVDSLHAYGDYDEASMFSYAAALVVESFYKHYLDDKLRQDFAKKLVEWKIMLTFAVEKYHTESWKMHTREEQMEAFGRLLDVLDQLREKCPWDRKQTNESLRPNTIEETYELCDALMRNDRKNICKELGDVLMHVMFYAKIGSETGDFDMADVCNQQADKLIFRHPHVYPPKEGAEFSDAKTSEQVLQNWEQIKLKEKDGNKTVLSGVPASLPSLIKAYRIQDKARNVGFDWEKKEDVWPKVREELDELEAELAKGDKELSTNELGDFLFAVINAARLYKLNPENALERTNQKFIRRFI